MGLEKDKKARPIQLSTEPYKHDNFSCEIIFARFIFSQLSLLKMFNEKNINSKRVLKRYSTPTLYAYSFPLTPRQRCPVDSRNSTFSFGSVTLVTYFRNETKTDFLSTQVQLYTFQKIIFKIRTLVLTVKLYDTKRDDQASTGFTSQKQLKQQIGFKIEFRRAGVEPATYGFLRISIQHFLLSDSTVHRSAN